MEGGVSGNDKSMDNHMEFVIFPPPPLQGLGAGEGANESLVETYAQLQLPGTNSILLHPRKKNFTRVKLKIHNRDEVQTNAKRIRVFSGKVVQECPRFAVGGQWRWIQHTKGWTKSDCQALFPLKGFDGVARRLVCTSYPQNRPAACRNSPIFVGFFAYAYCFSLKT